MTLPSRLAGLDSQSQEFLRMALASTAADVEARTAAYQSGYFALLSALSVDEIRLMGDHPSAKAAALAAQRLQLLPPDQALASDGAAAYYSPDSMLGTAAGLVAWARRVRAAARWAAV